jgi:hypothetical protein
LLRAIALAKEQFNPCRSHQPPGPRALVASFRAGWREAAAPARIDVWKSSLWSL